MRVESGEDKDDGEKVPCSPLKPLKSGLCLLRALGLPLRMGGEDGSHLTNKRAFALVLLLPIALDVTLVGGKCWVLWHGLPEPKTDVILNLFKKKGLKNWDIFRYAVRHFGLGSATIILDDIFFPQPIVDDAIQHRLYISLLLFLQRIRT